MRWGMRCERVFRLLLGLGVAVAVGVVVATSSASSYSFILIQLPAVSNSLGAGRELLRFASFYGI